MCFPSQPGVAVIPIIVGPLQVLMALLPVILVAIGSALLALFRPRTIKLLFRLLWRVKVTVILAVAVAIGLWVGMRAVWPRGGGPVSATDVGTNDWAIFRGTALRTGAVPGAESPTAGKINWAFTEVKTLYSSPAIVGNRIYISTAEKGPFTDRGAIYCLDADTGGIVWRSAPDRYLATYSSPSVLGKYVVVGEGLHMTHEARVVCLDREREGKVLWTYTTKSHVESSPAIAGGRVFIGAGDDGYYCFRLEPDAKGQPVVEWHLAGERYRDAETSPAVGDGRVFFGLGVAGQALVCADAATGSELWRVQTPSPVFTPPTVANGKVFFGMGQGNMIQSEEEVISDTREKLRKGGKSAAEVEGLTKSMRVNGEVWCVDQATNRVEWKFVSDRSVLGAVAAGHDRLFFATRGGTVYAVGYDGREIARWEARVPIASSPALTDRCLYVVTTGGRLYGLDRNSLQSVWEIGLGAGGNYVSSPAIVRGHVYVGTTDKGLLCVGAPGGKDTKILWAGNLGGGDQSGSIDGSALPEVGNLFWIHPPTDDTGKTKPPAIRAALAFMENRLYVPVAGGPRTGVACLQVKSGGQSDPTEKWFYATTNGVVTSPATDGESVFFVDGGVGAEGRQLHCVDAKSGAALWRRPVAANVSGSLSLADDGVLVQDRPASLACFGYDGKEWWRASVGGQAMPPAVSDNIVILATAAPGTLRVLDRATGVLLWEKDVDGAPVTAPVLDGTRICLGTDRAVVAYSVLGGSLLWTAMAAAPGAGAIARAGGALVYASAKNGLVVLDTKDGTVRKTVPDAMATVSPLVTRDGILYATKDNLMVMSWNGEKSEQWMETSWIGQLTAPPIMGESKVFFASDQYGVLCAGKGRQ